MERDNFFFISILLIKGQAPVPQQGKKVCRFMFNFIFTIGCTLLWLVVK